LIIDTRILGGNMRRQLVWGAGNAKESSSVHELEALLERLERDATTRPFMAELFVHGAGSLSIGLGSVVSVANFTSEGRHPPYFQSSRHGDDEDDDIVSFYGGAWSDFTPSSGIASTVALAAMRHFFESATRPDIIRWYEV
jgi:hypothetical protein